MFLHIIKNESHSNRPLLKTAMNSIMNRLKDVESKQNDLCKSNMTKYDNIDARNLHYLCVLVKDTELRSAMIKYYDEIMVASMHQIDNTEWTVCNAALQLFGALVPKIVGQKQSNDIEDIVDWESNEITYMEIILRFPKTCEYVLNYFKLKNKNQKKISTAAVILFLGLLSNVEHLMKNECECTKMLEKFRELFWNLLSHECEKVRQLAALCFVRAHELRYDLPKMLLRIGNFLFKVLNENFFQSLLFVLIQGIHKIDHEWRNTVTNTTYEDFFRSLRSILEQHFIDPSNINPYTMCKLADLITLCKFPSDSEIFLKTFSEHNFFNGSWGYDIWVEKVSCIKP